MSGGFFRGTSADQDTRFSNKQAKLLKSQKFAPELDHLVDTTKVKMDVMRPWIATRVTELLGFEDEVLINFIYGLLDGKEVNGKEVQISLTGFMEKNTGKFMKELWSLLLSGQENASGVPQQFLDAKEKETMKKKAETERMENDFKRQKDKETRELEMERMKKMDGELDISGDKDDAGFDQSSKHQPVASETQSADNKEKNVRNGSKAGSRSPRLGDHSPSRSRSMNKSFFNSKSYADRRQRSRSISGSPPSRRRSISSERVYHSPPRQSVTPRPRRSTERSLSLLRRRSSHSKGRSISRSHHRSPSPLRNRLRSPVLGRSRSPIRRRSRSPIRRRSRSPIRRRSRSPLRRSRSPLQHGSRMPLRRRSRSPLRRRLRSPLRPRSRSPLRRRLRSPVRRRSPSPIRRRSPSPIRRRSPSPVRRRYRRSPSTLTQMSLSPVRRRSLGGRRSRSPLPQELSSASPSWRTSSSPDRRNSHKRTRSSPRGKMRSNEKYSPVSHSSSKEYSKDKAKSREGSDSLERGPSTYLMSPHRDLRPQNNSRGIVQGFSPSPSKSLSVSPPAARRRMSSEDRSPYGSPVKQTSKFMSPIGSRSPPRKLKVQRSRHYSPETVEEEDRDARVDQKSNYSEKISLNSSVANNQKDYKDGYSLEKSINHHFDESLHGSQELQKKDQEMRSEIGHKADEKNLNHSDQRLEPETMSKLSGKADQRDHKGSVDSGSEESDRLRTGPKEKRKHKRSRRRELATDGDDSCDSLVEKGRKEAKKRRKGEKRQRKEEKRRRREERRRRREERHAEKLKLKSVSDFESNPDDGYASGGERVSKRESHAKDVEEKNSDPKRLEIELREKALESLRARKGVGR